jgi:hypothetical protein
LCRSEDGLRIAGFGLQIDESRAVLILT